MTPGIAGSSGAEMSARKILIAAAVAVAIVLPAMALFADLGNGHAAGSDYNWSLSQAAGWGPDYSVEIPDDEDFWSRWLCTWFGDC